MPATIVMEPRNERMLKRGAPGARIWEIDFLRGVSIILMVFYHAGYDLYHLCGIKSLFGVFIPIDGPVLQTLVVIFAGLFVVLSGASSTLSRNNPRRALKLLAVALVVTAATYVFDASSAIHFGILHFLGVSILLYGLALEKAGPWPCAAAAAGVFAGALGVSFLTRNVPIHFDWLLPFGIISDTYFSIDYFPLFPWFGVYLLGAVIGKAFYGPRRSLLGPWKPVPLINAAGRHSLAIYVLHQPLILGVLYLAGLLR